MKVRAFLFQNDARAAGSLEIRLEKKQNIIRGIKEGLYQEMSFPTFGNFSKIIL